VVWCGVVQETKTVLSAKKKTDQIALKDLWLKKVEMAETLRILRDMQVTCGPLLGPLSTPF
jgi:hypothetical protein